jgi:hypothetical protein
VDWESNIITDKVWETIHESLLDPSKNVIAYIQYVSIQYNMDKKNIIKQYFHYILLNKQEVITPALLDTIEYIMHTSADTDMNHLLAYFTHHLRHLFL